MSKLSSSFFKNANTVELARDLLGKVVFTKINSELTSGIITETEAYCGIEDKASHAYAGKRTSSNEVMFSDGGTIYIYLCYGIHNMLNIVTHEKENPHAILVRSIKPYQGIEIMEKRRNMNSEKKEFSNGPGKLTVCLGIDLDFNGIVLPNKRIWIEDLGIKPTDKEIKVTPRVGIDYAGEDALLPYRFVIESS